MSEPDTCGIHERPNWDACHICRRLARENWFWNQAVEECAAMVEDNDHVEHKDIADKLRELLMRKNASP